MMNPLLSRCTRWLSPILPILSTLFSALPALAHEGHGMEGPHYHATDAWGFVVMGGLMALVWWFTGRGK